MMIVGLDFDGTIVEHAYPEIGADLGAMPWLHKAKVLGAQFILFTMRDGHELKDAANYLMMHGISLYGANVNPTQWRWTMSPKAYCHLYVDDSGLGIPHLPGRKAVDWEKAGPMLLEELERYEEKHRVVITSSSRYAPELVE